MRGTYSPKTPIILNVTRRLAVGQLSRPQISTSIMADSRRGQFVTERRHETIRRLSILVDDSPLGLWIEDDAGRVADSTDRSVSDDGRVVAHESSNDGSDLLRRFRFVPEKTPWSFACTRSENSAFTLTFDPEGPFAAICVSTRTSAFAAPVVLLADVSECRGTRHTHE